MVGYCDEHNNHLIIISWFLCAAQQRANYFSFAAERELLMFCMQMRRTEKRGQRRGEDYLE
jgi:hypothetical protein